MATAMKHLDRRDLSVEDLMDLTRHGVRQVAEPPYHVETSGAAVMRPKTAEFWGGLGSSQHERLREDRILLTAHLRGSTRPAVILGTRVRRHQHTGNRHVGEEAA